MKNIKDLVKIELMILQLEGVSKEVVNGTNHN